MEEELLSQPETWARALAMSQERAVLPRDGERVAVIGCGTSWFIAQAYAGLREHAGKGITDAFTATETPTTREYDAYLTITRSGTTSEVIDFLSSPERRTPGARTIALLGDTDTPVASLADDYVDLGFADEQSVVQTRFATTALMFLRASIDPEDELRGVIDEARAALTDKAPENLVDAEQYTFLGQGWALGLATEAALKMRESARAWTESYNSMEYRHGPIAIAGPGRITWAFSAPPEGLQEQVEKTGATFIHRDEDPMVALVRLHQVALATARARGLDPDHPLNLTRSVVLDKQS